MNVLNADDLSVYFAGQPILDEISFGVDDGENVALVGPNGVGKTTLLNTIVGDVEADSGTIALTRGARHAYLRQEVEFDEADTPRDVVTAAVADVRQAVEEHERVSEQIAESADERDDLVERQHELQERIERLGGWDWRHRIDDMLDRLSIDDLVDAPLDGLSGGQRRRVALARVLLEYPDLLLLDEPTNHLDPATVEWLEDWLIEFPNALLFVSHDRYFLERVADRIVELDEHDGVFEHPPDYQTFMQRKLDRLDIRRRTQERQKKLIEDELDWLDRGVKSQGRESRKREDELEEMAERTEAVDYEEQTVDMALHAERDFGVRVLAARGIYKSYGDEQVLEDANLTVVHGDKIGLVGPNGCGKTTLLDIMVGREYEDAGRIEQGDKTDVAYMTQEGESFDPDDTIYEAFSASDYVWVGDTRHHKRHYLQHFLFDPDRQKEKVSTLSGGELRRLQLARIVGQNANLVILDEPTNNLDIASMQALEEALRAFNGCTIVVSHDRYFLNRVCNVIVAFEDGDLVRYEGDYDDYKRERDRLPGEWATDDTAAADASDGTAATEGQKESTDPPEPAPADDEPVGRPLSYDEQRELDGMEERILEAESRRNELQEELADPELYEERPEEAESLNEELEAVEDEIDRLYERWEELSERDQLS